jgi:hypothetical protein
VITTHALFALKVQRTESNGVAGLAAGRASLDQEKSRPIRASQRCRSVANIGAERLLVEPAISSSPQLKREQSPSPEFGLIPGICATFQRDNLRRHF